MCSCIRHIPRRIAITYRRGVAIFLFVLIMVFGDTKELMSKDKSLRFSCTIHLNKAESGDCRRKSIMIQLLCGMPVAGIAGIAISLILSIGSVASSIITQRSLVKEKKLKEIIEKRNKELLELYMDVKGLIQVEDNLLPLAGVAKATARKGFGISNRCEPKRVDEKIHELSILVKQ